MDILIAFCRCYGKNDYDELDEGFRLSITEEEAERYNSLAEEFHSHDEYEEEMTFSEFLEEDALLRSVLKRADTAIRDYLKPDPDYYDDPDEYAEELDDYEGLSFTVAFADPKEAMSLYEVN